jgi:hypothetical protein
MKRRRVKIEENALAYLIANEDRDDLYRQIGRFVFEYSQLEFSLRRVLRRKMGVKLEYDHLMVAGFDFAKVCFAIKELSALEEGGTPDPSLAKVISGCLKINELRVAVVHGRWSSSLGGDGVVHVPRSSMKRTMMLDKEGDLDRYANAIEKLQEDLVEVVTAGDDRRKAAAAEDPADS